MPDRFASVRRVAHRLAGCADHRAGNQRGGLPRFDGGIELLGQLPQIVVVGEIGAHGVFPVLVLAAQQIGRQRNLGMRNGAERGHRFDRIADQVFDGDVLVGDAIDEAGIGAVLEQATHQVRQQILVRADRCVHATGQSQAIGRNHFGIQVIAHAMQFLVFVMLGRCDCAYRRNGLRVVRGEHRIQRIAVREHAARAGQIRHVGILLAGKDRVAGVTFDLCALDLRVPVRALD